MYFNLQFCCESELHTSCNCENGEIRRNKHAFDEIKKKRLSFRTNRKLTESEDVIQ